MLFQKVKAIPDEEKSFSVFELVEICLNLFQLEGTNSASLPPHISIYNFQPRNIFPYLLPSSLLNVSRVLSPFNSRVLFVRHPLERLASAYMDKIAVLKEKTVLKDPGCDYLCRKISGQYLPYYMSQVSSGKVVPCGNIIYRFECFVEAILLHAERPGSLNEHWRPYSLMCEVCKLLFR